MREYLVPTRAKVIMGTVFLLVPFAITFLVTVLQRWWPTAGLLLWIGSSFLVAATFVVIRSLPNAPFILLPTATVIAAAAYALGCYVPRETSSRKGAVVVLVLFLFLFVVIAEGAEQVYARTTARGCEMPGDFCMVDCQYGPVNYRWPLFRVINLWGSGTCEEQFLFNAACQEGRCTLVPSIDESNSYG